MDIGRAFSYVFEDTEWIKKVLIGGIINLIPIVNFAAMGYGIEETRRVYDGRELPLPEWDNFGSYFMKGLMTFIAILIYSIPIIIIYCCMIVILPMLTGAGGGTVNGRGIPQPGPLAALAGPISICLACLILLYLLVLLVIVPALMVRYALTDQFGAFFQIGPAWQLINTNLSGYIMAVVVYVIAAMIAGIVGGIVCGIGAAFTGFWASLVSAYLFGGFARGSAAPVAPMGTAVS